MTRQEFSLLTQREEPVLLDGGTGSCLRERGMPVGVSTEWWVYEHPDVIGQLQREYADAGSQILYAPTFGANRATLKSAGLDDRLEELNRTLVRRTIENVGDRVIMAGDISTTGKAMEPAGTATYAELLAIYEEQMRILADAGVQLLVAETLLAMDEAMVICDAARAVCELPLIITFTCEGDGNLYFGGNVFEAAAALEAMGVDAVGVNCSVGPDQLAAVVKTLPETVSITIVVKPNAGMPTITETGKAIYSMGAEDFTRHLLHLWDCGASVIGGCCGTTPAYMRLLQEAIARRMLPGN
ncbi:MAG: homocysteine S-methyltransferase family protein [Lachnospiraceae bacterium]|nr:homocysteine S-methyltransferase family protein [Lachnospiraceae bacterium]